VRALALDFDGVLFDSAREAFAVALRAFAALRPRARLARMAAAPDPQANAALFSAFLELMPLGNRAEDYGVALAALEAGVRLPDQAAYDAWYAAQDAAWLRAYHARFYEERAAWARRDRESWLGLMPPFAPFLSVLRRRAGEVPYAIATAKDRASVRELLARHDAGDLFEPERILDKEAGRSKRAHLERLADQLDLPFAAITFVDDKVNHLEDVASLGVRCALAAWGYNSEREHIEARSAGFPVCTLAEAEPLLFGPLPAGKLR
jgi:phosphoglycolate phosphatase-like HAD superfamily hydrolase